MRKYTDEERKERAREAQKKRYYKNRAKYWSDPEYRAKVVERNRKNREKNKDKIKEYQKKQREKIKNDPVLLEKAREYGRKARAKQYHENIEHEREKLRNYWHANREELLAKRRKYEAENPGKYLEIRRKTMEKYALEHVKGTELNSLFDFLTIDIEVKSSLKFNFPQVLTLMKNLGYTVEEVIEYPPFKKKYDHYVSRIDDTRKSPQ